MTGQNKAPKSGQQGTWRWYHSLAVVALAAAVILINFNRNLDWRVGSWAGTLVLLTAFVVVVGHGVTGYAAGLLIDERNHMSLSRFQTLLWTILVISALLNIAIWNARLGRPDPAIPIATGSAGKASVPAPLDISIPAELLTVMGISITSLVGTPLIQSTKKAKDPDPAERDQTFEQLRNSGAKGIVNENPPDGQLVYKESPAYASLADMFRGEETGNAAQLDLGKVQLFYFTLLLVIAYGAAVVQLLRSGRSDGWSDHLPALSSGMVALLGISHAGYLTNKAAPHSRTGEGETAPAAVDGKLAPAQPQPVPVPLQPVPGIGE